MLGHPGSLSRPYIRIPIYVSVCLFRSLRCSSDLVHIVLFVVVISSSSLVLIGIVFCFCFFIYLCQVLFSSNKLNLHSSIHKTYIGDESVSFFFSSTSTIALAITFFFLSITSITLVIYTIILYG